MLHVVYIITKLELGGAQKVALTLTKGVPYEACSASLMAGAGGVLDDSVAQDSQVTLMPYLTREVMLSGIIVELRAWYELVRSLRALKKQHPCLVVHTHSTKAGLLGRWAAWCAGVKMRVHTIHGYAFHNHQSRITWWLTYVLELCTSFITTHFVCVSSTDYKTGCRLFPWFAKKSSMIRAAVAWDRFCGAYSESQQKNREPFVFGMVACFKPQKNIFDALYAFREVVESNAHVVLEIIGDGEQRMAIEQWVSHHELADKIRLLGWCYDVPERMAHWHAFVLTSLWEGLPCAIIEARLLRLPVLAYDTGGISDVITSGVNGYIYPQGAWKDMARDMLHLTVDAKLYHQLADHRDELQDFHDVTMIEKHRALYRQLSAVQKSF